MKCTGEDAAIADAEDGGKKRKTRLGRREKKKGLHEQEILKKGFLLFSL